MSLLIILKRDGIRKLKSMSIKGNRFKKFAEQKNQDGIINLLYYDCETKKFAMSKKRFRKSMSYVSVAIGSSVLSEFERLYGDPMDSIFSSRLNIYILILLPIINILINTLIDHIYNNKEKEFVYLNVSIEEVEKAYKKSWINGIIGTLILLIGIYFCYCAPLSGGRSVAIYFAETVLISDIPDYFEKKYTYKKIQKEMENK